VFCGRISIENCGRRRGEGGYGLEFKGAKLLVDNLPNYLVGSHGDFEGSGRVELVVNLIVANIKIAKIEANNTG